MTYEINRNKINGLLAERRKKKIDTSKYLGIDYSSLKRKINGTSEFTATEIAMLANYLEVDPNIFFINQIPKNDKTTGKDFLN